MFESARPCHRSRVFFVDDNLIGNKRRLRSELLPALIDWRRGKRGVQFYTEASIKLADDPALMALMVEAGFDTVFVGVETIVPRMGAQTQAEGYRRILERIYRPTAYYRRIRTFLRECGPGNGGRPTRGEVLAAIRSALRLGILGKERVQNRIASTTCFRPLERAPLVSMKRPRRPFRRWHST